MDRTPPVTVMIPPTLQATVCFVSCPSVKLHYWYSQLGRMQSPFREGLGHHGSNLFLAHGGETFPGTVSL